MYLITKHIKNVHKYFYEFHFCLFASETNNDLADARLY